MTDEDLRRPFEGGVTDMLRHFDVTAERLEKLDRSVEHLDQKIERTAADTQPMIKFSHAELE